MMETADLERLKSDEAALRRELEGAGVHFRGRQCRCPFHDDRTPSAGIFTKQGVWFFTCQVCGVSGTILDVRAKLNKRTVAEELRAMNETTARPPRQEKAAKVFPSAESLRAASVSYTHLRAHETGRKL